jgi:hypothetical protein
VDASKKQFPRSFFEETNGPAEDKKISMNGQKQVASKDFKM